MNARLDLRLAGRVQGVAFRWHTVREARALALTGWVRNLPDGSVRLVAEGPREALERLLAWAAHGPDRARVERCEPRWLAATGEFEDFDVAG